MTDRQRLWAGFLLVTAIGLGLYLPLLTTHYDLNGITEAEAVEDGGATDLFMPNHLLFRPIGFTVWHGLRGLGYAGDRSLGVLQVLSGMFGALGLGFMYVALSGLTQHRHIALVTVLLLGTSWSYWVSSTDVAYVTLAAMLAAASLAVFVHARSDLAFAGCGVLIAAAIFAWQANVFLLPILLAAVWLMGRNEAPSPLRRASLVGLTCVAVTGAGYVSVAIFVYGLEDLGAILAWGSRYGANALPMYGSWEAGDAVSTIAGLSQSVLGIELLEIGGFRSRIGLTMAPVWLAPTGFAILFGALISGCFYDRPPQSPGFRTGVWALIGYALYVAFISWWDSTEVRWLIVPNLFLACMAAISLSRILSRPRAPALVLIAVIAFAGMNFRSTMWPRRFEPSPSRTLTQCVADHTSENDLFVATDWNWADYLRYLHDRPMISVIGEITRTGGKESAFRSIEQAIRERRAGGGRAYITNPDSYQPSHIDWLGEQTGLTLDELYTLRGPFAFACGGWEFHRFNAESGMVQN